MIFVAAFIFGAPQVHHAEEAAGQGKKPRIRFFASKSTHGMDGVQSLDGSRAPSLPPQEFSPQA